MTLTGGLATEARLHRDGRIASPACKWCLSPTRDAAHPLRHCLHPVPVTQTRPRDYRTESRHPLSDLTTSSLTEEHAVCSAPAAAACSCTGRF